MRLVKVTDLLMMPLLTGKAAKQTSVPKILYDRYNKNLKFLTSRTFSLLSSK